MCSRSYGFFAFVLLSFAPCRALAQTSSAPSATNAQALDAGTRRAEAALQAHLRSLHAAELSGHSLAVSREELGCARLVRVGFNPPLYPGTGVATVLVGLDGRTHGQHGEVTELSSLARACGWFRTPPAPETFARFVSAAQFEGLLATRTPPTITLTQGVLRASLRRADPMSGNERETITFEVPAHGPATMTRAPIVAAAPAPVAPREVLRLAANGESVSALELLNAVRASTNSTDAQVQQWLAAISARTYASDTLNSTALLALGSSASAAGLLRTAWRTLSPERRTALLTLAGELHGPAFRQQIER